MNVKINPSKVNGTIIAPPSKSVSQRAIILASLADGTSILHHCGKSDDVQSVLKIVETLGAKVSFKGDKTFITGPIKLSSQTINCGESGLAARIFSALAALGSHPIVINGTGSLLKRPMTMIENTLKKMNVSIQSNHGFLPLVIKGPWEGGSISMDASETSQLLSGIIMAAPLASEHTTIYIEAIKSKPYIDLTLEVMKAFGAEAQQQNYNHFQIKANQRYRPVDMDIEGDWSGAAFMLVAGAIAGKVTVRNLSPFSKQPDKNILQLLMRTGARCSINEDFIEVEKQRLTPFAFDANDCPDLIPPAVALAAHCQGDSMIKGAKRLVHKESNRALTLKQEFEKMGIELQIEGDVIIVKGGKPHSAICHSHNDHRIAMACAVAALGADGETHILEADVVKKSYPDFFDKLLLLME
ncbi:MAG TPA: 3-phosphoshikimate 1-carboxyvinyltransferase [Salinivirgaceae bacterium]|nr:3-phosphoshikimate 1-carboxyvinyltransferase [Salinivirgaceae bacterium]